jgi:transmembrane sensor
MNKQIYQEASDWLVELRVGEIDAAARESLDAWFRASPAHVRAFLEVSSIWDEAGDPDIDQAHSTEELIARARVATGNVVPIDAAPPKAHTTPSVLVPGVPAHATAVPTLPGATDADGQAASATKRGASRPRARGFRLAASLAAIAISASVATWVYVARFPSYTTSIGEQRTVRLSDGSLIELNALSRLRVNFSKAERDVELIAGQAMFKVAKDVTRPFVVSSDVARVRAVGTEFDVNRRAANTVVTVIEGRVAILPAAGASAGEGNAPDLGGSPQARRLNTDSAQPFGSGSAGPEPTFVSAGEQVTVTAQATRRTDHPNIAGATAWTQRELVFDGTPLTDVAEEFNRYNEKPLVVSDASLSDFHVTGVFSSTNPSSLLKFLRAQRGIRVDETDQGIRISRQ